MHMPVDTSDVTFAVTLLAGRTDVQQNEHPTSGRSAVADDLEVELNETSEQSVVEAAEISQREFGRPPAQMGRFERDLQAAGLSWSVRLRKKECLSEAAKLLLALREQPLGTRDPAINLAHRCLLERFEEMLAEQQRAWEGVDPEGVHQMRVATRRIRAAFRAFKGVLPADSIKEFNGQFKWVGNVLGAVRDLDVYQDNLQHYTAEIPEEDGVCLIDYQQHLAELWQNARNNLLACLSSQRYLELLEGFTEFLKRSPVKTAAKTSRTLSIGDAATRLIGKQYKKVLHNGRAIMPESPDESLHSLRMDCKRQRYLFEFFQPIYGKPLRPFIKQLKKLQDVLGEFHDACVATQRLRQYAECVPMQIKNRVQLIALGQLIYAQGQQAADRRARFHETWKRFDRKGQRTRIVHLLGRRH